MTDDLPERSVDLVGLTAEIVAAYVSNNPVPTSELSRIIADRHVAMSALRTGSSPAIEEKRVPAVPIKKSVTPDVLICLEDGKKFKSLKRHLATHYELPPDEYRRKWNLTPDYPMVAPSYSAVRSALAKTMGLGRKAAVVAPPPPPSSKRKKIGLKFS
ncbi:MucR family transcriptional regulator [Agrobacterium tumefaciens]|uniref:MucR family transcriptional regulator n=1 Tax=Agrobacterium tumefaciens TaxID=358 RepID=UPI002243488E|nr:MucR family transcriptional regulator [Agrobacterium tumefaciens]MCW8060544.1 MucR family transcriptional regulator [Agrobacterium tumefaciens]MCW8145987.1 MucR family transcriptional regulator [Agrobacterium tumefaciens]